MIEFMLVSLIVLALLLMIINYVGLQDLKLQNLINDLQNRYDVLLHIVSENLTEEIKDELLKKYIDKIETMQDEPEVSTKEG